MARKTSPTHADDFSLEDALLQTLRQANRPLSKDELMRIMHLPRRQKKQLDALLLVLKDAGKLARAARGWAVAGKLTTVEGVLSVQRAGMGFISRSDGNRADLYVHPANMGDAWHGDTVQALILPGRQGRSPEARVIKVLHRAHAEIPVFALRRQKDGTWLCIPENSRLQAMFVTDVSALPALPQKNDLLLVVPGEKSGDGLWLAAATLNLENEDSPAAQERLTKSNNGVPTAFLPNTLQAAAALPEAPRETDLAGRRDLRHLPFVTIDGNTARDFDDAVLVQPERPEGPDGSEGGGFRLFVAIADVSHYVRENAPLDAEARLRGNSYYFPLSVEPMFPEALSNGLCSLRPLEDRLAMVAELRCSARGAVTGSTFYPAVIRSAARLTYGQIQRALLLGQEEDRKALGELVSVLEPAERLARLMAGRRRARGSLEFDLPEPVIVFDENSRITGVAARERHFGHQMIEEFMIAANEAVAAFLARSNVPFLYRVHPEPDPEKLANLFSFLQQAGLAEGLQPRARKKAGGKRGSSREAAAPATVSPRQLQELMRRVQGAPQEYMVNRMLLRSMKQARYSTENEGHFGLASSCYCHFTSPIRRYADLVVHRALKTALELEDHGPGSTPGRLETTARHINETERTAVDAEREIYKRYAILFLQDRVGDEFDATVSGVTDFGLFAELRGVMAEGMVRLQDLGDDYFEYVPERQELRGTKSGAVYRLGQTLRVRVVDLSLSRLEITLVPVEPVGGKREPRRRADRVSAPARGTTAAAQRPARSLAKKNTRSR